MTFRLQSHPTQLKTSCTASQCASGPSLGNISNKTPITERVPNRPPSIWALLRHQNLISRTKAPSQCGTHGLRGSVSISRESSSGNLRVNGLQYCRSNQCVFCSLQKQRLEAEKWTKLLLKAKKADLQVVFGVFTIRTSSRIQNSHALDVLKKATGLLLRKQWREKRGIVGHLRAYEMTFDIKTGKAHPHVNICIITSSSTVIDSSWRDELASRWQTLVRKIDPRHSPDLDSGVFLQRLESKKDIEHVASYSTKLGLESSTSKEALLSFSKKSVGLNPRELLLLSLQGNQRARFLFLHWQKLVSSLRRFCTSRGLKALLTDVDAPAEKEPIQAQSQTVVRFGPKSWSLVWSSNSLSNILDKLSCSSSHEDDLLAKLVYCCDFEMLSASDFLAYLEKWLVYKALKT